MLAYRNDNLNNSSVADYTYIFHEIYGITLTRLRTVRSGPVAQSASQYPRSYHWIRWIV